jgi:hypothetical protein
LLENKNELRSVQTALFSREILMRKTGLIFGLIVMLASASVQAQKSLQPRITPPTPEPTEVVVRDDNGGGYLVFDTKTGTYECNLCEYGYVLSGTGEVKIDGCNIYFYAFEEGYRMFATLDMCGHQAKVGIDMFDMKGLPVDPISESCRTTI